MSQKENIFRFNHINKSKTKEEIQEIKELSKYYHFKFWVYQKAYKHFKIKYGVNWRYSSRDSDRFEKQYATKFLSCLTETVEQNGEQFETTNSSPGPLAQ